MTSSSWSMLTNSGELADAASIPYITPDEARRLLEDEVSRLLALLQTLAPDDWNRPTACTLWNVRDMVAHQAGGYASGTGYRELFRQYLRVPKRGQLPEDAINKFQLVVRASKSPAELIAELRATGPAAIRNWAYGFRLFKPLAIPDPRAGWLSMRHLMLVVHSRDTWMHRLDICRATGRPFEQTREHDGRINELVVRDLARWLAPKLSPHAITLDLAGSIGGSWKIGKGTPSATIRMDALDFNIYASGRFTPDAATALAEFSGDNDLAARALREFKVVY
jgi:uncharacterized protein (TIGR03083 family)